MELSSDYGTIYWDDCYDYDYERDENNLTCSVF